MLNPFLRRLHVSGDLGRLAAVGCCLDCKVKRWHDHDQYDGGSWLLSFVLEDS